MDDTTEKMNRRGRRSRGENVKMGKLYMRRLLPIIVSTKKGSWSFPNHSPVTKELASDNQTGTYTVQQAFSRSPKQLKCASQRRLLTIKCLISPAVAFSRSRNVLALPLGIPPLSFFYQ